MECEFAKLSWFNFEVLECLRGTVDLLIDEFSLNFVGRNSWPPQHLVKHIGYWLEDALWNVDVPSVLDDLPIDQFANLRH